MREQTARLALAVLAASSAVVGLWAGFAPRSFYEDFPGGGRTWVAVDGPYNEHLVRDVGELNLGLAVVLALGAWFGGRWLIRAAAAGYLVQGLPHFVYHLRHLDPLESTGDKVGNVVSLGLGVLLPILVLLLYRPERDRSAQPVEAA